MPEMSDLCYLGKTRMSHKVGAKVELVYGICVFNFLLPAKILCTEMPTKFSQIPCFCCRSAGPN